MGMKRNGTGASLGAPVQVSSEAPAATTETLVDAQAGASPSPSLGALAQVSSDVTRVAVAVPRDVTSCTVDGVSYDVQEDGLVYVAPAHASALIAHFGG